MSSALWLAVIASALGTLLMRLLPLLWMQRHLKRLGDDDLEAMPQWLGLLGPLMITAVFGVSLVPTRTDAISWIATLVGLLATLVVWRRTRTLGWPVAAGVAAYGAAVMLVAWGT
ncbi:AzlD domain-containing protein [Halomonas korlensis]|uniref:Branched-chain amino acid transport protein (AzlD) n=1 Tax=Halomonas korlensis TaxID=463301 RepID=A0A1I7HWI2_9GAMM|nr:AzlD domain-containing protein [Halomonas korlensis]SFU64989.1 Branched-chain amino acid transport protein (AzlD) [Halomonas korlensis]